MLVDDKQAREKIPTPKVDEIGLRLTGEMGLYCDDRSLSQYNDLLDLAKDLEREVESLSAQVADAHALLALAAENEAGLNELLRTAEAQVAELKKDAERLDRLDARADDWTYKGQRAWSFRCDENLSLREALDFIAAKESGP